MNFDEIKTALLKAAQGDHTGRPSIMGLCERITKAIDEDPRFDTDSHGKPEGSPEDIEPYCFDITVPDNTGRMFAIIRRDDGVIVKHGFTFDGSAVSLDPGAPMPTEPTTVYAAAMESYHAFVRASRAAPAAEVESPVGILHCNESAAQFEDLPTSEFMWMPAGTHMIQASYEGKPARVCVTCDQSGFEAVKASFERAVKRSPNRPPFGCVEHREKDATFWPEGFAFKDDGIYCKAQWTELGVRCVRGRTFRSFSPAFSCNAEWCKAVDNGDGILVFPEGVRGSQSNPASVTGVSPKSVGSLTNWPAFKEISPVKASQADPQPAMKPAEQQQNIHIMKIKFIKASSCGKYAAGTMHDLDVAVAQPFLSAGEAATPEIADRVITLEAERARQADTNIALVGQAIVRAQERNALPKDKDGRRDPKTEAAYVRATGYVSKGVPVSDIVELLDGMPGDAIQPKPVKASLFERQSAGASGDGGVAGSRLDLGNETVQEACDGILKAYDPMVGPVNGQLGLVRAGRIGDAIKQSQFIANKFKTVIRPVLDKGGDFSLAEMVRAADTADPNGQLGTIATGILLMQDLGYLKAKLIPMAFATTDLSAEPVKFNQQVITRYKTPPNVLTFVKGVGYTANANDTTRTVSTPSTTDVPINMQQNKAVCIKFDNALLASTARNLFAEQQSMQFYSLAKAINQHFISTMLAATWTPKTEAGAALDAPQFNANGWSIPSLVTVKNKLTLSQVPDEGRRVLLHSFFHDILLQDSNLLTAAVIKAALMQQSNPAMTVFGQQQLPTLFGLDVIETQLFSDTPYLDKNWSPSVFGMAGTRASAVFVTRPPTDYTEVLPGIPATAAIQLVTEPDSGMTMMFSKWVDHNAKETNAECAIMYQAAQGHPGQAFLLKTVGGAQN